MSVQIQDGVDFKKRILKNQITRASEACKESLIRVLGNRVAGLDFVCGATISRLECWKEIVVN